MADMTRESAFTFSKERVRKIYLEGLKIRRSDSETPFFKSHRLEWDHTLDLFRIYSSDQRKSRAQQWSRSYYHSMRDSKQHITQLDETVSTLVQGFFDDNLDDSVITDTCDLLARLPATPRLPHILSTGIDHQALHPDYFRQGQSIRAVLDHDTWHSLLVTNWIDTNTIKIALTMVQLEQQSGFRGFQTGSKVNYGHGFNSGSRFKVYVDTLAEILEASCELSPSDEELPDQRFWILVRSFFWTCWHRSPMLNHHYLLRSQLIAGIISLIECLISVHNHGRLDIANLFLTNQHLLRATKPSPGGIKNAYTQRLLDGYISVEESTCLLAYRHASRPGDSTVIMSLLNDTTPFYTATAFWKSKVGGMIRSGMLFSSQPRLQSPGLGWAPAQPEVAAVSTNITALHTEQYLLFDGYDTEPAFIKADGLDALFATFDVPTAPWLYRLTRDLGESARRMLPWIGGERSASPKGLLCRIQELFRLHKYRYGLFLLSFRSNGPSPGDPNYHLYYGQSKGTIFAAVGTNDENEARWHWLGTIEWDSTAPWPQPRSEKERIFLV
ncbi:MAG: hypothetical protein Q9160_005255 [Pyrenula sp. 1 TL-2023]